MICVWAYAQKFFAADTSLFLVVRDPRVTAETLNENLSKVS